MALVLTFALVLVVAVLVSGFAQRSILSTAVLFLVAGFVAGDGVGGWLHVRPESSLVLELAELALFSVLFTDGMAAGVGDLRAAWRLPGRALLFGMPLTFGGGAVLLHWLVGLNWPEAMLVAAVLTPTDPVFAAAIVGREDVPYRLRHLLNVESGLNDGLALPAVLILLSFVAPATRSSAPVVVGELALGVVVGVVVPWVVLRLERLPAFGAVGRYQPLNAFAIGVLVYAICAATQANPFLAAFAAGSTVASVSPAARASFHQFGELVAELLKLAALLVFGALLTPRMWGEIGVGGYVFVVLLLVLVRPVSLVLSLLGTRLDKVEWAAAAWFGPKGFASVTYGLLILHTAAARRGLLFAIIAVTIAVSITAHSTTDTVIARWFNEELGPPRLPRGMRQLPRGVRRLRRAAWRRRSGDRPPGADGGEPSDGDLAGRASREH